MFHLSARPLFRRVLATTLLALAGTSLVACGGDDKEPVGVAATSATTPATTPASTPDQSDVPNVPIAATKEGSKAVKAASTKKISASALTSLETTVTNALESAGITGTKVTSKNSDLVNLRSGKTSISLYRSDKAAAEAAADYVTLLKARPGYGHVARNGNIVYLASSTLKLTDADVTAFDAVRTAVEGAL